MVWISKWSPRSCSSKVGFHLLIFEYISNDDEQSWHRLKLLFSSTLSRGRGAGSLGEALEDRVGPLVEGGELERLEGADGDTGKETDRKGERSEVRGREGRSRVSQGKSLDTNVKED